MARRVTRARKGGVQTATLIPGDGIGPEVIDSAVQVIEAAGGRIAWDVQLAGKAAFEKTGTAIPEALLASIRRTHVGLKGPLETCAPSGPCPGYGVPSPGSI